MTWHHLRVGQGTLGTLFVGSLLFGNACSNDSTVSFDPVAGSSSTDGDDAPSGGSTQSGAGTGTGATDRGGSSEGGSDAQGGSEHAGNSNGGADAAGTDTGGSANGGNQSAGMNAGGNGGAAGSSSAGMSGGGAGGGSAGNGGAGAGGGGNGGGGAGGGGSGGAGAGGGGSGGGGSGGSGGSTSCTPKPEICDGIDNNCDNKIDPSGTCPDGCVGATYGGHIYYFCGVVDSGQAALTKCAGFGMAPVRIDTKGEDDFVASTEKSSSWLGATDEAQEGEWRWVNGNVLFWTGGTNGAAVGTLYNAWLTGQPNDNGTAGAHENCAVIFPATNVTQAGLWNDLACDLKGYRATCESTGPSAAGP